MSYLLVYPSAIPPPPATEIPITLTRVASSAGNIASFGVPFARGVVTATRQLTIPGYSLSVTPTLYWYNAAGVATSIKAVRIQLVLPSSPASVTLHTGQQGSVDWPLATTAFADVSHAVNHSFPVGDYTIEYVGGVYQFATTNDTDFVLFASREPCVYATFADSYLASTGIFGPLLSAQQVAADPDLAGVKYLSDAIAPCVRSACYISDWRLNADRVTYPMPIEGYLYDRPATILLAYAHANAADLILPACRYAWAYQSQVRLTATPTKGIWTGKTPDDSKYSHPRGLYLYYALTGDEGALAAIDAIGELWRDETGTSVQYQAGSLPGSQTLWTERELACALEGTLFGFFATGTASYLAAFDDLLDTAYTHISTQTQATLDAIMVPYESGGITYNFPPQNAFIHNGQQQTDSLATNPWASSWMTELILAPLLTYQEQADDDRVDEIFVRLARFLRDTGLAYTYTPGSFSNDTFMNPTLDYSTPGSRRAFAWYGSGRYKNLSRYTRYNEDIEHAPDTSALTAAGVRGLARQPGLDAGANPPFATEAATFRAMHHEISYTAKGAIETRDYWYYRDPSRPTGTYHTQSRLATAYAGGQTAIDAYIATWWVGAPKYYISPERKVSWWLNNAMLQFGLMDEAAFALTSIVQGWVLVADQDEPIVLEEVTADTGLTALIAAWHVEAAGLDPPRTVVAYPAAVVGDFAGTGRPDIVMGYHGDVGARLFACTGYDGNDVPQYADVTAARTLSGVGFYLGTNGVAADGSPYLHDWQGIGKPSIIFTSDEYTTYVAVNNGSGSFDFIAVGNIDCCQMRPTANPTSGRVDLMGVYAQYWPFEQHTNNGGGSYTKVAAKTHGEWGEFTTPMRLRPAMTRYAEVTFTNRDGDLDVVWPDHLMRLARIVRFRATGAGVLPTGITADTDYWVAQKLTNSFKVQASYPGTPVVYTDGGTAPVECWYDLERPTCRTVDLGSAIGEVCFVCFGQASDLSPDRYSFAIQGDDIGGWTDITAAIGLPSDHRFFVAAVFDQNLDGLLDLVLTDCTTGGVYLNNGIGQLVRHEDELSADIAAHTIQTGCQTVAALADFDEDGIPELLLQHTRYGQPSRFYRNRGGGYVRDYEFPQGAMHFLIDDFNRDGRLDIAAIVDISGYEGPWLRMWLNRTPTEGHFVQVALTGPSTNLLGVDAVIRAYNEGHVGDANYLVSTVVNGCVGSPTHLSLGGVGHSVGGGRPIHVSVGAATVVDLRATFPGGASVDALAVYPAGQTITMVVT